MSDVVIVRACPSCGGTNTWVSYEDPSAFYCGDGCRYWRPTAAEELADERADIIARFTAELAKVTGDGSRKRKAGTKPPWYEDDSHEGAVFSHLTKWKRGELVDPDSGAHPLVHAAWRLLAIALKETGNIPGNTPDH